MTRHARPALTLIELLVVIVFILVIASLTVIYVVPAFSDNKNVQRGMDRVITTLLISRQRALRDQGPRGVRFLVGADGFARDLRYIEQPDPYRAGSVAITGQDATFTGANLLGSAVAGNIEDYAVQPGDWLHVGGANMELSAITGATTATTWRTLTTPLSASSYKIIRQPRPITGEEDVKLPMNVGINITLMNTTGPSHQIPVRTNTLAAGIYEILFDPAGGVINRSTATPIVLWVQDTTATNSAEANTTRLIAIYPRTGLIAAHPIGPAGNPLQYALDGKSSGS